MYSHSLKWQRWPQYLKGAEARQPTSLRTSALRSKGLHSAVWWWNKVLALFHILRMRPAGDKCCQSVRLPHENGLPLIPVCTIPHENLCPLNSCVFGTVSDWNYTNKRGSEGIIIRRSGPKGYNYANVLKAKTILGLFQPAHIVVSSSDSLPFPKEFFLPLSSWQI